MKKKLNDSLNRYKYYFSVLRDFSKLNNYIFLSTKFINRVEKLLFSDLPDELILENIKICYSDFKNDYDRDDFSEGVNVKNEFK